MSQAAYPWRRIDGLRCDSPPQLGERSFKNLGACRGLRSSCGDPCASCHACSRILLTGHSISWGLSACNCIPRVLVGENRTEVRVKRS